MSDFHDNRGSDPGGLGKSFGSQRPIFGCLSSVFSSPRHHFWALFICFFSPHVGRTTSCVLRMPGHLCLVLRRQLLCCLSRALLLSLSRCGSVGARLCTAHVSCTSPTRTPLSCGMTKDWPCGFAGIQSCTKHDVHRARTGSSRTHAHACASLPHTHTVSFTACFGIHSE